MAVGLLSGFPVTMGRQVVGLVLGLAWAVLLARAVGPEGAGLVTLGMLTAQGGALFLSVGLPWSTAYLVASGRYRFDEAAWLSLTLVGIIVIALLSLWFTAQSLMPGLLSTLNPTIWIGSWGVPAVVGLQVLGGVFHGQADFRRHAQVVLLPLLVSLILGIVLVWLGHRGPGFLMGAWLAGQYAALTLVALMVGRQARRSLPTPKALHAYLRSSLSYGWKLQIGEFASFGRARSDSFILAAMIGAWPVGIYNGAVRIVERLWMVSHAAMFVVFPMVARGEDDGPERRQLTPLVARWNLYLALAGSLVLMLVARPLIKLLYGEEFRESFRPLLLLLPGVIALAVSRVTTADLSGRGRPEIPMKISLVAWGLSLACNVALIPRFGISGAAVAASVTNLVNAWLCIRAHHTLSGLPYRSLFVGSRDDIRLIRESLRRR